MRKILFLIGVFIIVNNLTAQVLTWRPLFSTAEDTITIVYDATQGNGALIGVSQVYVHTGVITDKSPEPNWWLYVKTDWGENTPETQMTPLGNDRWQIRFHIRSYYGVPEDEKILKLAFVFRNVSSSLEGRNADGSDIFVPIYEEGMNIVLLSPTQFPFFVENNDSFQIHAVGVLSSTLSLWIEEDLVLQVNSDTLMYTVQATEYGRKDVQIIAEDSTGAQKSVSLYYVVNSQLVVEELPNGIIDGIR